VSETGNLNGLININDNRDNWQPVDDAQYILRLIGQIITVSLDTVKIVKGIEKLEIE